MIDYPTLHLDTNQTQIKVKEYNRILHLDRYDRLSNIALRHKLK